MSARFTLLVCASRDGFIARAPGHAPAAWASAEEQALFLAAVDAADWAVMGRATHEAAPRPDRRRIVFSRSAPRPEWRAPTQLWLDPATLAPGDLPGLVSAVRPLRAGLILGGTAVHGWFHDRGAIDAARLTVEPVDFGEGLPIFPGDGARDPMTAFLARGFTVTGEQRLNARGARLVDLAPQPCGRHRAPRPS